MRIEGFLVIEGNEGRFGHWTGRIARVTARKPRTAANEVALQLTIEIPDAMFMKPVLQARMVVPPEAVSAPVIEPEVANNIAELVRDQLGIKLHISAEPAQGDQE